MKKTLFLIFLFLAAASGISQVLKPIEWKVELSNENPQVGDEVEIRFKSKIEENWYLYSSDFDPDLGPMLTEFTFNENETYELVGETEPVGAKKKYDSLWEGEYTYFKKAGLFVQKVKILKEDFSITGSYSYQVCSDIDGKCIPFDDEFSLGKTTNKSDIKKKAESTAEESGSLWSILITAFLAGLVALLTPCVYPMIPITVSIFLKQSKSRKEGIGKALIYGVSIIVFFSLLGFLISLIWGFTALNELSTHWLFNLIIFSVFILFALSFFGLFEITLPSGLVTKIDRQADRGGLVGIFFMAITLVLVSFSCTFPIVGTALINTLSGGSIIEGTTAMFGFSLAFAIPFTGFAIFPAWLKSMPESGGWLNSVKVVLGFLELALALKFLSVADLAYHWGILDREVFIALWITIFGLLGLYLIGKIKLKSDTDSNKISVARLILAICTFAFTISLIPGLWGAPLKSLSGFLPPMATHNFNLLEAEAGGNTCEEPKYADLLHWPHGLQGYFDYEQAVACAKEQGKPIFIDFTGHGCVNCREMEQRVWSDPAVLKRLSENFVLVALYVDDRTKLPESEWYQSSYDGKTKKTIGQQNADFQINRFNNNAQPFYVILNEDEELLVKPKAYNLDVSAFVDFLDKALENHRKNTVL
ncbi:thiol:disulfide interchange protein DsbD [Ekhidna lutea]|uniref:Thiol:disulfide interchange protein DsbD n=1 Tax=Ekhidna lutea TaxID=447679 RepID=A0A239EVE2_EKHLU|nr:thioredoxin family protein [Ekhidna lutea]SNS48401.1 thiol:disulfide interchange protein DsbD [Ekhidna lutea]